MSLRRLPRRAFLGLAGVGLAGPIFAGRPQPVLAAEPLPRVHRWESQPDATTAESVVYLPPHPFNAIGVLWKGPDDAIEIRAGIAGHWSDWLPVHRHPGSGHAEPGDWQAGDLVAFRSASQVQYRARKVGVTRVRCELIDSAAGPGVAGRSALGGSVISRAQWGADERLRFSKGEERWPVEYAPVEKVVVHHTVTQTEEADPAATVRSIYVYHATLVDPKPDGSAGWGDIGYNLLVDWRGNVYEGRFGGPGAVAAHARGYNTGSAGIAFLGTYSGAYIPAASEEGFASVVSSSFGFLDPFGSSFFADKSLANICGHRDCLSTECPGNFGYRQLPNLRDAVARWRGTPRQQAQLTYARFTSERGSEDVVRFEIEVWNNSRNRIETQGPEPEAIYDEYQNSASIGHPGQTDRWRIGVDFADNATGKVYPYRWGLGKALEPGERRMVRGQIELVQPKRSIWWAGLIQEGIAYRTELFGVGRPIPTTASRVFVPLASRNGNGPEPLLRDC
ncbi:MAG: N-acetylmuramoyl-L-alanine amidase [Dehalococcoidia bacterium]